MHVRYADEAYLLGPSPARDSYLRGDKIIDIARKCGADAIHPGMDFWPNVQTLPRLVQMPDWFSSVPGLLQSPPWAIKPLPAPPLPRQESGLYQERRGKDLFRMMT